MGINYASVKVAEHEKQLEEYSKIVNYTNKVLDSITDVHNISENNMYDIMYAQKLLRNATDITDEAIARAVKDILARISLIIDLVKDEDIKDTIDKKQYNNITNAKYDKSSRLKSLEDYTKPKYKSESSIGHYFKTKGPALLIVVIATGLFLAGIPQKMAGGIVNVLNGATKSSTEALDTTVTTSDAISNVNVAEVADVARGMDNAFSTLLTLIIVLALLVATIGAIIDLSYLTMPWLRDMFDTLGVGKGARAFISEQALEATKAEGQTYQDGFETSKEYNRMSLAQTMYHNMVYDNNFHVLHKDELNKLKNIPKSKKENIARLVEVELLYNNEYKNQE